MSKTVSKLVNYQQQEHDSLKQHSLDLSRQSGKVVTVTDLHRIAIKNLLQKLDKEKIKRDE